MSKKYKSQASSARAASVTFGTPSFGFGSAQPSFQTSSSLLSYVTELPDLGGITDPNVVVSLRNLSKKDNTTKAKALEELQQFVLSQQTKGESIEDGVLEAWVGHVQRCTYGIFRSDKISRPVFSPASP